MLKDEIAGGFGQAEDYNCAEKILRGANQAYELGLDETALCLCSGFGGGLGIESTCGALCSGAMVLSHLLTQATAHQSPALKPEIKGFLASFEAEMGSIYCDVLKAKYRTPALKCQVVIEKAAEVLDRAVAEALPER